MKKYIFILFSLSAWQVNAQQLTPQQKQMLQQMGITTSDPKEALKQMKEMHQKGQHPDFKAEGQKMVNKMTMESGDKRSPQSSAYPVFTSNAELVPAKDVKRINGVSKKIFSNSEMLSNTKLLYNKMMAKLPAAEKSIIASVTAQQTAGAELNNASVNAMMQGHRLAALGLAMQAVIAKPGNLNYQNNMAALLTENGYPENAIPYLNTIQQQLPNNSTVKNNLGYAWLNLGEIDSAQRILTAAAALNPENAETTTGTGVIEEKKGNIEEAGKKYEEAFVQHPSSMGQMLITNAGRSNPYENMSFDDIKYKITIYEYFKKEWLTIPDLSNSVEGYQHDIALLNGYTEMFRNIISKLQKVEDSLRGSTDMHINTEYNHYAENIRIPIMNYFGPFREKIIQSDADEENSLKPIESAAGDAAYKADHCEARNVIWDDKYLRRVNPGLKSHYLKNLEKYRLWINAYITYSMILLNEQMPKQYLLDVLYFVKLFIGYADQAATALKALPSQCNLTYDMKAIRQVKEYELPKILCPVNIKSIPGTGNNINNINKSATGTAPNATIALGSSEGSIAEPGKAGTPAVTTSQGELSSSGINGQDAYWNFHQGVAEQVNGVSSAIAGNVAREDYVTPVADEIKKTKTNADNDNDFAPLPKMWKNSYLKNWLNEQLVTNCDNLKKMEQNPPVPSSQQDMKSQFDQDQQNVQKRMDQLNQQNDPANAKELASCKTVLTELQKAKDGIERKSQADPGWADKFGQSVVSPTINNGLQTPGSNASYIPGMFD